MPQHSKQGKKQKYKRIFAGVLAVLIAVIMVLSLIYPIFANAAPALGAGSGIEISGEIGYNRMFRVMDYTPFRIHLVNNGADFSGRLQIMLDVSRSTNSRNFVAYSSEIALPGGGAQLVEMYIPLTRIRPAHRVVLMDDEGREAASAMLLAQAIDPALVMAGILTEQPQAANHLRALHFEVPGSLATQRHLVNRLIHLGEHNFPRSSQTLSSFDIIIIDDFSTNRLSQDQLAALDEWVSAGGLLVLGGGEGFSKLELPGLPVPERVGSLSLTSLEGLDYFEELSIQGPIQSLTLDVFDIAWQENSPYVVVADYDGQDIAITHVVRHGEGSIVVHAFSLVYQGGFAGLNGAADFLSSIYEPLLPSTPREHDNMGSHQFTWSINNLPSLDNDFIIFILVSIGIYAISICTAVYFILKWRDKREYGFVVIPILAVMVTAAVYMFSLGSNYRVPISNTITRVELGPASGRAFADSLTAVSAPTSGDVDVRLANNAPISFELGQGAWDWGGMPMLPPGQVAEREEAEIFLGGSPRITYLGRSVWEAGHFSQSKNLEFPGGIYADVLIENGMIVGTITNNTGLKLQDVMVGVGEEFENKGQLQSGESLSINQELLPFSSRGLWGVPQDMLPIEGRVGGMADQRPGSGHPRDINVRRSILGNVVGAHPSMNAVRVGASRGGYADELLYLLELGGGIEMHVIAFNYDDIMGKGLVVNGAYPSSMHTNIIETRFLLGLDILEGFSHIHPGLVQPAEIAASGPFNFSPGFGNISVQGGGVLQVVFELGGVELEYIDVFWETAPEAYLFNHSSGEWEPLSGYYDEQLAEIMGPEARLVLRTEVSEFEWLNAPEIAIGGTGGN